MLDLGTVALFSGLDRQALASLLASARQIRIARARHLFFEHDHATTLYVVCHGWVRLFKLADDGQQSVIRLVGPSEIAGMSALLDTNVYQLTAQAATTTQLLAWERPDLERLMEYYPQVRENALRLLSNYLDELQQQYLELATERVEQRIAHVLVRVATRYGKHADTTIVIPLSQRDVADLAGVTHYTVSRVLGEWRTETIVATRRSSIHILDLQRLMTHTHSIK